MKIIDEFLPQKEFRDIQTLLMNEPTPQTVENLHAPTLGWEYQSSIIGRTNIVGLDVLENDKHFYMLHMVYLINVLSPLYDKLVPVIIKLDVKSLIRIKCNLYPNSEKIYEHGLHSDYPFSHKTAIFYINTCNGYTKFEDGTKIESIANRILVFDGSVPHQSTNTSDATARFNINFNYF
jgi:hypothetical protein